MTDGAKIGAHEALIARKIGLKSPEKSHNLKKNRSFSKNYLTNNEKL